MTYTPPQVTAFHEAAHAVVYLLLDIDISDITVMVDGGWCFPLGEPPPSYARLVATLAGRESDRFILRDRPEDLRNRESGWKGDLKQAEGLLRDLGGAYCMEDAVADSARLVRENWDLIQSLGQLLFAGLQADRREGADRYMMLGSTVKVHIDTMRTGRASPGP
jgi:hypothetical protein